MNKNRFNKTKASKQSIHYVDKEFVSESIADSTLKRLIKKLESAGFKLNKDFTVNKQKTGFIASDNDEAIAMVDELADDYLTVEINGTDVLIHELSPVNESQVDKQLLLKSYQTRVGGICQNAIRHVNKFDELMLLNTVKKELIEKFGMKPLESIKLITEQLDILQSETNPETIVDAAKIIKEALDNADDDKMSYADVLVVDRDGKILILQRPADDDFEAGKWCVPGGKSRIGEQLELAAVRELEEEAGIIVDENDLNFKFKFTNDDGSTSSFYAVQLDDSEPIVPADDEHQDYAWITLDELDDYDLMLDTKSRLQIMLDSSSSVTNLDEIPEIEKEATVINRFTV